MKKLPNAINNQIPEYKEYDTGNLESDGTRGTQRFVRDTKSE
jgi:hypothetical protein